MSPGFEDRLARRRELVRRQQLRRRRAVIASVLVVVVIAAAALALTRSQDDSAPDGRGAANTGQKTEPPSQSESRQETSTAAAGAQPDDTWKPSKAPVPILMYHVIGEPAGDVAFPDLYLSTEDFRAQVKWLAENGYTAVTLVQVQAAWYDGASLPDKPVVLSFDDGYLGQYLDAMPILRDQSWAGQLNLKSEGSDLSSKQVKKMIRAGWEIASHTITHPDLRKISAEQLKEELEGSKRQLERDLGVEIVNFCYPAGMYDDEVVAAVEAAGYRGATTVNPGLGSRDMPFELNRIRIDRGDGADALAGKLSSAGA